MRTAAGIFSALEPVSTGNAHFLANNANHCMDESGRVLINAIGTTYFAAAPATTTGRFVRIAAFGPFPVTVGSNGMPYPVRVRVAGSGDGKVGASVQFRVVASQPGQGSNWVNVAGASNVTESAAVGNTPAWLTASSTLLTFDSATQGTFPMTTASTIDSAGGSETGVSVCMMMIEVWGITLGGGSDIWLHGLLAQEYVGV